MKRFIGLLGWSMLVMVVLPINCMAWLINLIFTACVAVISKRDCKEQFEDIIDSVQNNVSDIIGGYKDIWKW